MFEFRFHPRAQLPPGREFLIAFGRTYSFASLFLLGFGYLLEEPFEGSLYVVCWGVGIALALLALFMLLKPFVGLLRNILIAKRTRRLHLRIELADEGLSVMYGGNVALTVPREHIDECVYRRIAGQLQGRQSGFGVNCRRIDELTASEDQKAHMHRSRGRHGFHLWFDSRLIGDSKQVEEFIQQARTHFPNFRDESVSRGSERFGYFTDWRREDSFLVAFATLIYCLILSKLFGII
jgi:hypothetical protein